MDPNFPLHFSYLSPSLSYPDDVTHMAQKNESEIIQYFRSQFGLCHLQRTISGTTWPFGASFKAPGTINQQDCRFNLLSLVKGRLLAPCKSSSAGTPRYKKKRLQQSSIVKARKRSFLSLANTAISTTKLLKKEKRWFQIFPSLCCDDVLREAKITLSQSIRKVYMYF